MRGTWTPGAEAPPTQSTGQEPGDENEGDTVCQICGQKFRGRQGLAAHVVLEHTEGTDRDQEWVCMEANCGRKFTNQGRLKLHKKECHAQPTPSKVRKCHLCGEGQVPRFAGTNSFRLHMMEQHGDRHKTEDGDYKCPSCDYRCPTRKGMDSHVGKEHPDVRLHRTSSHGFTQVEAEAQAAAKAQAKAAQPKPKAARPASMKKGVYRGPPAVVPKAKPKSRRRKPKPAATEQQRAQQPQQPQQAAAAKPKPQPKSKPQPKKLRGASGRAGGRGR